MKLLRIQKQFNSPEQKALRRKLDYRMGLKAKFLSPDDRLKLSDIIDKNGTIHMARQLNKKPGTVYGSNIHDRINFKDSVSENIERITGGQPKVPLMKFTSQLGKLGKQHN